MSVNQKSKVFPNISVILGAKIMRQFHLWIFVSLGSMSLTRFSNNLNSLCSKYLCVPCGLRLLTTISVHPLSSLPNLAKAKAPHKTQCKVPYHSSSELATFIYPLYLKNLQGILRKGTEEERIHEL